ncbi:ribulose-phosphate 3-epimerase [Paratissierella segnis]|jgi:ribulose-phosphate 3-epimerase|uniref:Ribulose-phosphate 3-epimerase n=1 Tax=Paratissierella segnis TaxID=2763679 RepID=A0A926ESE7_9FIRM|nr:ribulose-phosphate 3-epimerase [Paratissierella segnis]MBC8588011.1 ribulose-phosphate 3-epimerase [Paratissierella segnis]
MKKILCPSMMCADFDNLKKEVELLDEAGADMFHCDIMDGVFVPNMALSPYDVECIKRNTKKPVDVHLMVSNVEIVCDIYIDLNIDIIYIHPESSFHISKTLLRIKEAGIAPGIAISPDVSIETVKELLPLVDYIMIMTVNPGFSGQVYLQYVNDKIDRIIKIRKDYGFKIMLDGAISDKIIQTLTQKGVDGFVLGTSALFREDKDYETVLAKYRKL